MIPLAGNRIQSLVFLKHVSQLNALSQGNVFSGNWFLSYREHSKSGKLLYATSAISYQSDREWTSMFWNEVSLCFPIKENLNMVIQKRGSSHTLGKSFWCLCLYWFMAEKIAVSSSWSVEWTKRMHIHAYFHFI